LESDGYRKDDDNTLLSSIYVEQELPFIEGLKVKGVFSYDPTTNNDKLWHIPYVYHIIDLSQKPYTYTEAISLQEQTGAPYTWLQLENRRQTKFTYQGYINYDRVFGNHNISALFVAEARKTKNDYFNARRNNFALDIDELSLGSSSKLDYDNGGSSGTASEIGYVYRVGYTYKDKYILEASGRYDGHYSFAPGKRWGYFPAFSAAWRISEENFMKNITSINNLKVRSSWGKSGNLPYIDGELADFQYLSGYSLRGNAYAFGSGNLVQAAGQTNEPNKEITWEISTKFDIGFDLTMWNGLFNAEFDYFHEDRTDMLLPPQVTVPVEYGLALSQENKGSMDNNGFELGVGTQKLFDNGFQFSLNANVSYSENNMLEVFQSDAERNNPNRTRVGRPYGTPYGYKSLGLFTTAEDTNGDGIINSTDGYGVEQFGDLHPGDIKYADLSGPDGVPDGKIDSNDETVIGHPVYPSTTYGMNASVGYKGFNLSLFFQGTANSNINIRTFLTSPFDNNGSNTSYEYFANRWTPDHQDARYPRATPSPYSNNTQASDFWMVNTGYLRLKTAVLSYSLPQSVTEKFKMSNIAFHLTGQNLLTFSKLDFIDPELGYDDRETSYPITKSLAFGIDISF
jgi:TonB-linked SusC/RagA family outer membrane protein